jgi:hypothetical protein
MSDFRGRQRKPSELDTPQAAPRLEASRAFWELAGIGYGGRPLRQYIGKTRAATGYRGFFVASTGSRPQRFNLIHPGFDGLFDVTDRAPGQTRAVGRLCWRFDWRGVFGEFGCHRRLFEFRQTG